MADINNPPAGGFKEGGWYWDPAIKEAKQYSGGGFGAGTTINNPNQQGYGERVSEEVQAQSGYVAPRPTPQSQDQVTPYLNKFQGDSFQSDGAPSVKVPTMDELRKDLLPEGGRPDLINRNQEFERLREEHGVAGLEQSLNDLKAQEDEEVAFFREQRFDERGKPVAMGVIQGRISEEENAAQERLDAIGRQKSRVVDQLNTTYSLINMYMTNAGLDYQDASVRYNEDFNSNLKMYDIITGKEAQARSAFESDRAAASANLTTFTNAIMGGNLDYNSLAPDQKSMITKLEVQSGMPAGFTGNLQMDPGANILFTSSNEGITQVGIRNADGSISVQKYGERISSTSKKEDTQKEMSAFLGSKSGDDGYVDGGTYTYARQKWVDEGGDPDDYDSKFRVYRNPSYLDQYKLEADGYKY